MAQDDGIRRLDELSDARVADYLRRSSLTYLECCIALMLTHLSREEVAAVLREEAQLLEEFG